MNQVWTKKVGVDTMKNAKYTPEDLAAYAAHIVADYKAMYGGEMPAHNPTFEVTFQPGTKYTRVVTNNGNSRSAHSFLDAEGNIWKTATWRAPAKNFTRGNILTKDFTRVAWTGAQ
jgi:hypothetical protein